LKFGIVTINYLRPLVLRLWLASMDRLRSQFGSFPVVCVSGAEDKTICDQHKVSHLALPNKPLSDKWNAGFLFMKATDIDYVIILGSDDIMSNEYMERAIEAMNTDIRLIYTKEIYFYSAMKDYTGQLFHYVHRNPLGVGRCIHYSIMEKINWTPYTYPKNYGMDAVLTKAVSLYIHKSREIKGPIVDVKTRVNMNSIRIWARKIETPTPSEVFYNFLSQPELDLLERIKKS
jgi:hypothetical protein